MSDPNYDEIRQRITNRYENRIQFAGHLLVFLVVNGLIWSGALGVWPMLDWITGAWSLGLAIHFVKFFMAEARERAIDAEREWSTGEKPKRDSRVRLTVDGELETVAEDDEDDYMPERKRPQD